MRPNDQAALEIDIDLTTQELLAPFAMDVMEVDDITMLDSIGIDAPATNDQKNEETTIEDVSLADVAIEEVAITEIALDETSEIELTPDQMDAMLDGRWP